jgi:hypothetical protein
MFVRLNCTSSYFLGVHTEHRNKNTITIVICHNAIHSQYGGCNAAMRKINKTPDTATHICLSVILFHKFICLSLHNHTIPQRYPTRPIPWHLYADRAGLNLDHIASPPVRLGSPSVRLHRDADSHARLYCALCHSVNLHRDNRRDRHGIQLSNPLTHATSYGHGAHSPCGGTPDFYVFRTCGTGHRLSTSAMCAEYASGRW